MGIGGVLGVGTGGCIFLGMIESPLLIRPYINRMTRSELFAMMATGMSCIAGTMLMLYATVLKDVVARRRGPYPGRLDHPRPGPPCWWPP